MPGVLTGCAGEHFVAYQLSARGYPVALTRGGSPSVDLMVATPDGRKAVTIQVKSMDRAYHPPTKKSPGYWEWILGNKPPNKSMHAQALFYAFVDLKAGTSQSPDVFIVPHDYVAEHAIGFPKPPKEARTFWFDIEEGERDKWREGWRLIEDALGYVVVPERKQQSTARMRSPRLADPSRAAQFEMEVVEESPDARV